MGVRSSCATSAVRLRRCWSARSNSATMRLKERASLPNSPEPLSGTRTLKSPSATSSAAAITRARGLTILRNDRMAIAPARSGKAKPRPQLNAKMGRVAWPSPPRRRVSKNASPAMPPTNNSTATPKNQIKRKKRKRRLLCQSERKRRGPQGGFWCLPKRRIPHHSWGSKSFLGWFLRL